MKIARFSTGGDPRYGILDGDEFVVLGGDPMFSGFAPQSHGRQTASRSDGTGDWGPTTGERVPLADAKLLAPVIPRSKVVAVGRNYVDHVAEFGGEVPKEPLLFLKPNTSVIGPGDAIVLPPQSHRVDFEGELAVVIGRIAKNVKAADAASVIFGYTVANDVTARDLQKTDGQWSRAKGFDTFCPLGPVIETEFVVAENTVSTRVNGEVKQDAPLTDMVFSIATVIEHASAVFTLLPGDVILTGTPAGVGKLVEGDTVEVTVSGIGTLRNPVRSA